VPAELRIARSIRGDPLTAEPKCISGIRISKGGLFPASSPALMVQQKYADLLIARAYAAQRGRKHVVFLGTQKKHEDPCS
jgi:hypothetical protein